MAGSSPADDGTLGDIAEDARRIILIGMPGAGKSTLGSALAKRLGWAYLDTDRLMESWYGLPLEALRRALGSEQFLQAEERTLLDLDVRRCVIATGGSAVYSSRAMRALKSSGVVIYLQADYSTISHRVSQQPERGLVMQPGQTLMDLYQERCRLYEKYADRILNTARGSIQDCIQTLESSFYAHWYPKHSSR